RCSTALGEDDSVDSGSVGGAEQGAEVLGVLNTVEGQPQAGGGAGEKVFQIKEFASADDGDDSLMGGSMGETSQFFSRLKAKADGVFAGCVDDFLQALVVPFTGDAQVVELAAAGAESLLNRVQAVQNVHEASLQSRIFIAPRRGSGFRMVP